VSSDHVVRLRALLDDLEHGRAGHGDAADRLRGMQFPQPARRTTGQHLDAAAEGDLPELPPEGGFHEVEQAYVQGRISHAQYRVLAEAAAQGMREPRVSGA
jgi:hypothetical protein